MEPETPPASSVTVSVAARAPAAEGVKVTGMVQVPAAGMLPVQVLPGSLKSAAFVPEMATEAMFSAAVPVLVSVMVCGALVVPTLVLAKVREVGERDAPETAAGVAVPVSVMTDGLSAALSVRVMVAVFAPVSVGAKVAEMVHLELAARVVPQLLLVVN